MQAAQIFQTNLPFSEPQLFRHWPQYLWLQLAEMPFVTLRRSRLAHTVCAMQQNRLTNSNANESNNGSPEYYWTWMPSIQPYDEIYHISVKLVF